MFLNEAGTLDAIEALAGRDELILYCGAGVSIDRTGRSWRQLINGVFSAAKERVGAGNEIDHAAIKYLLDHHTEFDQFASLINEHFTEQGATDVNDFLFPILQDLLYRKSWSEGYLLRNTVQLAIVASSLGKKVTLLTTNYDTYLERRFKQFRDVVERASNDTGQSMVFPGLTRKVVVAGRTASGRIASHIEYAPQGTTACVDVLYLHGRVPGPGGPAEGTIVLDERSYAATRASSAKQLEDYFGRASAGVLILGASLTDKPLVQALINTKASGALRTALYAGLPRVSSTRSEPISLSHGGTHVLAQADVEAAYRNRGSHIGANLLFPLAHFQSAQFVEELQLATRLAAGAGSAYRDAGVGIRYSERLRKWADSRRTSGMNSADAHQKLAEALDQIVAYAGGKLDRKHLRLEVWLRINPRSTDRNLYMFSSSAGPILDDDVRRREPIAPETHNASVKAFLAGKPLLSRLEDLGLPANATRWGGFLSVPIFLQESVEIGGEPVAGTVPAGVITLAGLEAAHLGSNFDALAAKPLQEILTLLIARGRTIAQPAVAGA